MTDTTLPNDPGSDISRLLQAVTESLTDSMIER